MVRHVCGTCRSFQAADASRKSGWCVHPLKQTSSDVRILVRAGELNCRNDWDKDLWQLREDGDRVLDVSMAKPDDRRDTPGRPQRVLPLRSLGEDDSRPSQPLPPPDDILIGQDLDAPRLVSDDINREMLKRAREQYRARRLTTRPDGPSPRLGDGPAPALHRSEAIVISNEVQSIQIGKEPGPDLTRISDRDRKPVDDAELGGVSTRSVFSSVPEVQETISLPRRRDERPDAMSSVDDFEMESIKHYDEVVETLRPSRPTDSPRHTTVQTRSDDDRSLGAFSWDEDGSKLDGEPEQSTSEQPRDEAPSLQTTATWASDGLRVIDPDEIRPWDYVEPRRTRPTEIDGRDGARPASAALSRLWAEIPRCCRTCRDFRAAEAGGGGGWCMNPWAFRHRRMVDMDQLTCETTIGDWWLPTDDAWQDDYDIGRHALSTPLMDKWFGRPKEEADSYYPEVASRTRRRS